MKKKSKKSIPLLDVKFGIYSFLQGCIVLSSFLLVWKLITFHVDTSSVDDFLDKARHDLAASVDNTATVVSNLVVLVYNLPQMISATSSVSSFVSSGNSLNSSTNSFVPRYVNGYSFSRHKGICCFSCSDVAGDYVIGDLWIDGSPIVDISEKGFFTCSGAWFARSYRRVRSVAPSLPSSLPSRLSSGFLDDFRSEDYVVKNERGI